MRILGTVQGFLSRGSLLNACVSQFLCHKSLVPDAVSAILCHKSMVTNPMFVPNAISAVFQM